VIRELLISTINQRWAWGLRYNRNSSCPVSDANDRSSLRRNLKLPSFIHREKDQWYAVTLPSPPHCLILNPIKSGTTNLRPHIANTPHTPDRTCLVLLLLVLPTTLRLPRPLILQALSSIGESVTEHLSLPP
jgi:hypothetical protein